MGFAKGKEIGGARRWPWRWRWPAFFATWAVFGLRYELNDDAQLANIAMGAYGEDTHHLVYVNVLLGWFLKPFYALAANVNWYYFSAGGGQCGGLRHAGHTVYGAPWHQARPAFVRRGAAGLWGGYVQQLPVYQKQRPVPDGGACAAGVRAWRMEPSHGGWPVLGRVGQHGAFSELLCGGRPCRGTLLWRFLCLEKRARLRALAAAVALFALVGAAKAVDLAAYSTGGWRSFTEYNAARTEFSDFKIYSYTDKTQIEALGYTANDFDMLKSWSFYAPEVFTPQALDALSENAPQAGFVQTAKKHGVYAGRPAGRPAVPAGVWRRAAGVAVFCRQKGQAGLSGHHGRVWRRGVLPAVSGTVCAACGIFHDTGGGGVWRNVHIAARRAVPGRRALGFAAAAVCVVCLPYFMQLRTDMQQYRIDRVDRPEYYEMSADKEHLYLMDVETLDSLAGNNVFHPRPAGFFSNIVELGAGFPARRTA